MTEPRTIALLYEAIEKEWTWRIMELSNYKSNVLTQNKNNKVQEPLIRAGVALIYAHWEGFIKKGADLYYEFVSYQDCKICELSDCFVSIALRGELEQWQNSKRLTLHNSIIKTFFEEQNKKANFSSTSPIKTSNLRYHIFEDVCLMIGVNIDAFHQRYFARDFDRNIEKTINDLVEKRNSIAHGEYLSIREQDFTVLYNIFVNGFLYCFKEMIMDSAQNGLFKRK
jgi:hypothetical protein